MSVPPGACGYVQVSLGALTRNYAMLREAAQGVEVGAVVKADAYGLGAARVSQAFFEAGCKEFFVATLEEGEALRKTLASGDGSTIYVFEGLRDGAQQRLVDHALVPVLNTSEQIDRWSAVGAACAVHVDTGMNRLGVSVDQAIAALGNAEARERLGLQLLMTHLACADEPENENNRLQLERFAAVREHVGDVRASIANSAGAFLDTAFHGDLIRAGIALYGGNPFSDYENPMETVATLYARVLQVRSLEEGATVGYGATFHAPADCRIATVGVGYADGYPRMLGNTALAAYNGVRLPVVGRVSMDLIGLDVTDLGPDGIAVGDYVEMFGEHVPVDELAELCSTISYELLAGLNVRLPRVYAD